MADRLDTVSALPTARAAPRPDVPPRRVPITAHRPLLAAVGILLLGFGLRLYRLGDTNIWWDEGLAVWAVRKSFLATTAWTASDVHPPLYFWTLWPWTRLVGESEFAARFITLIVGMLTVAVLVPFGRRLGGPWIGLLAALLLATSRFHIWWSQEMRMYALAGLLNLLALLALLRWWQSGSRRAWLAYVLAAAGALYTIYLSVVMLVAHNLWVAGMMAAHWWQARQATTDPQPSTTAWRGARSVERGEARAGADPLAARQRVAGWIGAQVAIMALFAPWLAYALGRMSSWSVAEPVDYGFVARLQATLLTLGISTDIDRVTPLMLGLVLVFGVGVVALFRWPGSGPAVALLLLTLVLPSLVIFALALPRGLFYNPRVEARYFLPFAPPIYALFAWALAALWRWRRVVGLVAALFVAGAWLWTLPGHYTDRYLRDDLQSMVQALRAHARPDDAVLLVSGNRYPVFLYYYERGLAEPRPSVAQLPRDALTLDADNVDRELRRATRDHDRVWLAWVNGPLQDPDALAPAWLRREKREALSYGFGHNSLSLFTGEGAPPPVTQAPTTQAPQPFGDGRIAGYDLPVREYRPGDTLRLGIYWEGPTTAARLGLWPTTRSAEAGIAAARPVGLPIGQERIQVELPIPRFMTPGPYEALLTGPTGAAARLGQVRVSHAQPPGAPDRPLDARLGQSIRLRGLSLVGADGKAMTAVAPGQSVNVDLFWAADAPPAADYTVFVHLLAESFNPATGGPLWAGHDGPPAEGQSATSWWDENTQLRDRHALTLPDDLPPGPYQLEIGLYDGNGVRLPVTGVGADTEQRRVIMPVAAGP